MKDMLTETDVVPRDTLPLDGFTEYPLGTPMVYEYVLLMGSGSEMPDPEVDIVAPSRVTDHVFPFSPDSWNTMDTSWNLIGTSTSDPLTVMDPDGFEGVYFSPDEEGILMVYE